MQTHTRQLSLTHSRHAHPVHMWVYVDAFVTHNALPLRRGGNNLGLGFARARYICPLWGYHETQRPSIKMHLDGLIEHLGNQPPKPIDAILPRLLEMERPENIRAKGDALLALVFQYAELGQDNHDAIKQVLRALPEFPDPKHHDDVEWARAYAIAHLEECVPGLNSIAKRAWQYVVSKLVRTYAQHPPALTLVDAPHPGRGGSETESGTESDPESGAE